MDASRRGDHLCGQRAGRPRNAGPHCRKSCSIDLLIDDIREELRGRPYDLVAVAGGFRHLTRPAYADAIRAATGSSGKRRRPDAIRSAGLDVHRLLPITRAELSSVFGKEISRDLIGHLRSFGLIASGPRSPTPGAPTPMSRRKRSCWSSGSKPCAIFPTSRRSRMRGCCRRKSCLRAISCRGFRARRE
ncbi:SMC-Scp complex subunit ScpB [Mesorhizobium sp. M1328]